MNSTEHNKPVVVWDKPGGGPTLDVELIYEDQQKAIQGWKAFMSHPGVSGAFDSRESITSGQTVPADLAVATLIGPKASWLYCVVIDPIGNGQSIGAESCLQAPKWLRGRWMATISMPTEQVARVTNCGEYLYFGNNGGEAFSDELLALYDRLIGICKDVHQKAPLSFASIQPELLFEHELHWSKEPYMTVPAEVAAALSLPIAGKTSMHAILTI